MDGIANEQVKMGFIVGGGIAAIFIISYLVGLTLITYRNIFRKAGQPGWVAFIPFYNQLILYRIAGLSSRRFILSFVPFLYRYEQTILVEHLSKAFGKKSTFQNKYFFFGIFPILMDLGFGPSKYIGTSSPEKIQETIPTHVA